MPNARLNKAQRLERLNTWVQLRLTGHSYESIAQQYDCSRQNVFTLVTNELRKRADQSVDQYRNELISQHDLVIDSMMKRVVMGDAQAAAQVLRALTSKAQLLGANAIVTSRLEVQNSDGSIDERIQSLVDELASNDANLSKNVAQASDQA